MKLNMSSVTVQDSDILSPISVELFPEHCKTMHENSDRPFAEEYQVNE